MRKPIVLYKQSVLEKASVGLDLKAMYLESQVMAHILLSSFFLVIMFLASPIDGAAGQPSSNQSSTIEPSVNGPSNNELSILTNMTTGTELEVIAYAPQGVDPKRHLSNALSKPVLLVCTKCNRSHPWKLPFIKFLGKESQGSYAGWQITEDMSVRPDKDELIHIPANSTFFPMEVVSRVIDFTRPTPCPLGQRYPCTGGPFERTSKTEIFSVMQRVQEVFSSPGFCVANDKNTGLHIHYGNGDGRPPARTALGMFGIFAALERLFDSASTCSRMPLLPSKGHPNCGIPRPSAVYKYDQKMEESRFIGSLSCVFLHNLRINHNAITSGRVGDPQAKRVAALKILRKANVPGMLSDITSFDDVGEFMDYHPSTSGLEYRPPRYLAINLTNLGTGGSGPPKGYKYGKGGTKDSESDKKWESDKKNCTDERCICGRCEKAPNSEKGNVEVRLNSGTMDPSDVWGSYEFMGKLMLWLYTPGIDHNAVILSLWADPESTLLDLINEVGAS
jgi:hypothetical protein